MIKHIVFFRFEDRQEIDSFLQEFKKRIEALTSIPEVLEIEAGLNFSDRDVAFDIALYSTFASREGLDVYKDHPDHVALLGFLEGRKREVAVVDYEI